MPYCVHCGVEMAPSEKSCPLCQTLVQDPACPWTPPESMPYPERVEEVFKHIDLRYGRSLAVLVLLIPALVVLAVNLLSSGSITWSLYVIGALVCVYCWFLVPLFYRFRRPYAYIAIDFITLALYLLLIARMTGGRAWYMGIALPVLAAMVILVQLVILAIRRLEWQPLERAAVVCLLVAGFLVAIDAIADLYTGQVFLNWSVYAGLPLLVLAGVFLVLEKKRGLKDAIKKRLFV
mgnify:CR=1 FL=1